MLQNNWSLTFKSATVMRTKERLNTEEDNRDMIERNVRF